jgi:RNA-binding protein
LPQFPIAYVDVRFCVHATEDEDSVLEAFHNVLPIENEEDAIEFTETATEGHYGNPIIFFESRIKNKNAIKILLDNLSAKLGSLNKTELRATLDRCFEKGSLFLRVDKQAAFQDKIRLASSDPIRLRIRFRKSKLEDVTQICQEIGLLT